MRSKVLVSAASWTFAMRLIWIQGHFRTANAGTCATAFVRAWLGQPLLRCQPLSGIVSELTPGRDLSTSQFERRRTEHGSLSCEARGCLKEHLVCEL